MKESPDLRDDQFQIYDLTVVVESIDGNCTCAMSVGDEFYMKGGKISLPPDQDYCVYALNSVLPLLPAKQRQNAPADWMETDARVICPDPECKLIMRIDRNQLRTLDHDDVSPVPWSGIKDER